MKKKLFLVFAFISSSLFAVEQPKLGEKIEGDKLVKVKEALAYGLEGLNNRNCTFEYPGQAAYTFDLMLIATQAENSMVEYYEGSEDSGADIIYVINNDYYHTKGYFFFYTDSSKRMVSEVTWKYYSTNVTQRKENIGTLRDPKMVTIEEGGSLLNSGNCN